MCAQARKFLLTALSPKANAIIRSSTSGRTWAIASPKTLRACSPGGDSAVTHWQSLGCGGGRSLLRVTLDTGRTHQIRVHFAYIGAPLTGDSMYGTAVTVPAHQLLHCGRAEFVHPVTGQKMTIEATVPPDMRAIIQGINSGVASE